MSKLIDLELEYINRTSWLVRENANVNESAITLFWYVAKQSVLEDVLKFIPPRAVRAHREGWIHINKLFDGGWFLPYCCGVDTARILQKGLITPNISSRPPKHLDSAVDQLANFIMMMAQERTGAIGLNAIDLYLAPFIAHDKLSYDQVKQCIQRFIYNLNYTTRVGYQCLSEDTKILTPEGWKSYSEIKVGDLIYTFNIKTGKIELKPVKYVFVRHYRGKMYNLKGRSLDKLISPGHRVVWKFSDTEGYRYTPIEEVLQCRSQINIPTPASTELENTDYPISDEEIKLIALFLADGTVDRFQHNGRTYYRISICLPNQLHPECLKEILETLDKLSLRYSIIEREKLSDISVKEVKLDIESSKRMIEIIGIVPNPHKKPPEWLYKLSRRQAKLFIETYAKISGFIENDEDSGVESIKIVATDEEIAEALAAVAVFAGYSVTIRKHKSGLEPEREQYTLLLTKSKIEKVTEITEVEYDGIIWSVNTENETVIAMRNGTIFITGNTPFSNVTFGLGVREYYSAPAFVGGKIVGRLGDYVNEALTVLRAFCEVLLEGDAYGKPFTFPIPTVIVTDEFVKLLDESPEVSDLFWKCVAERGSFYFLNSLTSDRTGIFSFCCRLTVDVRKVVEYLHMSRGVWALPPSTGSIGYITINLPRIAIEASMRGDAEKYVDELLYEYMNIGREVLNILRARYVKLHKLGYYPLTRLYIDEHDPFKYYYNTIAVTGMAEYVSIILNEPKLWFREINFDGRELVKDVIRVYRRTFEYMGKILEEFEEEDKVLYNLEQAPAESSSYRFARLDWERYPKYREFIPHGIDPYTGREEPYYTSQNTPPYTSWRLESQIIVESEIQKLFTGGVMKHIFVHRPVKKEKVKDLVLSICRNTDIVYLSYAPTQSICLDCGYRTTEVIWECPKCGSKNVEQWTRIVGYYRPVRSWNPGRRTEFAVRRDFARDFA